MCRAGSIVSDMGGKFRHATKGSVCCTAYYAVHHDVSIVVVFHNVCNYQVFPTWNFAMNEPVLLSFVLRSVLVPEFIGQSECR